MLVYVLKQGSIPNHIAFIMDGNRRYATKRGMRKSKGHEFGFMSLKKCLEWCLHLGIRVVTVYAFSLDNFKRDREEVDTIMRLAKDKLLEIAQKGEFLSTNDIRVDICGDLDRLEPDVSKSLKDVETMTSKHKSLVLNICFAYDSQYEIGRAVKGFVKAEDLTKFSIENSKELAKLHQKFKVYLFIKDEPDILVRTSNEIRLSDFLIFQSTFTELCFLKETWPDMNIVSFMKIILQFQLNEKANRQLRERIRTDYGY